jgi:large subunit ribosomal protein L21
MYAVIETGGKQFRVELGTTLEVDRLDAEPGTTLTLERVLLVADGDVAEIGRPTVANASVSAEVVGATRGEKVIVFKYKPKARRRVKKGHRSELTVLRITDIRLDGRSAAADETRQVEARKTERERLAEAAARQAEADAALAKTLAARAEPKATDDAASGKAKPAAAKTGARSAKSKPTAAEAKPTAAEAKPGAEAKSPAEAKPRRRASTKPEAGGDAEAPAAPKRTRRPKTTTEE